jgi:HSP20 family protein
MSLNKRDRLAAWPLETLWNQELVDGAFRDMLRGFFTGEGLIDRMFEPGTHLMRVEEYVDGDTAVFRGELPGLDPNKDIELKVVDGVLHVRAERKEQTEEERPDGFRTEFHYGSLARSVRLPEGATEADVSATYKDGILEVRVPAPKKAPPAAPAPIPITRG